MSEEPLPGDLTEATIPNDLSPEEREAVAFSSEVVELLDEALSCVADKPVQLSFNGGMVLLTRELPGEDSAFMFNVSESVSLTYLLGCLEVTKAAVVRMIERGSDVEDEEDDASPAS